MQLAHPAMTSAPFLVAPHGEGWVLLGEPLRRGGRLLLVGLGLRLDGLIDDRLREDHLLENDPLVASAATSVSPVPVREPDGRHKLTRIDLVALLPPVGVQLQQPADALAPVLGRVHDVRAGLERARVHPYVGQPPDVRVGLDLEGESG